MLDVERVRESTMATCLAVTFMAKLDANMANADKKTQKLLRESRDCHRTRHVLIELALIVT